MSVRVGTWELCPVCQGCGTVPYNFYARLLGASASIDREPCRRCLGRGTIVSALVETEIEKQIQARSVGWGCEQVGPLGDYIAANLREVLKVIPDTGDWHALVCQACEKALDGSNAAPNYVAGWYRKRILEGEGSS